ncbi:MAG: hypothetical protein AAFP16_16775 [Pseudomonadota bacterium]
MKIFRSAAILLFLPNSLFAEEKLNTDMCLSMKSDAARLICYDRALGYKEPEEIFPTGDGWVLMPGIDEFTEKDVSRVFVEEKDRAGARDAAVISVGCREEGGYGILFYKSSFINTSSRVSVRYRFDENQPVSESWWGTTSSNGAMLPDNYKDFRAQLLESDALVIEVTDYQGGRHRHAFEGLQNNKNDLEFVMSGCISN